MVNFAFVRTLMQIRVHALLPDNHLLGTLSRLRGPLFHEKLRNKLQFPYGSLVTTTSKLIWLKALLASLGVFHDSAMHLHCDSQAALHIAKNLVFHERTRHIELDCHFVQEKLEVGDITFSYIPSKHQPVDIFTKGLGKK